MCMLCDIMSPKIDQNQFQEGTNHCSTHSQCETVVVDGSLLLLLKVKEEEGYTSIKKAVKCPSSGCGTVIL